MESDSNNIITEIVEEHNKIRTNPKSYIPILEKYISYIKNNTLYIPGAPCGIILQEGKSAYTEAINFLKSAKAVGKLTLNEALCKSAYDHAKDLGTNGDMDHTGSDGSTTSDRIERYTSWEGLCCENIDFGATTGEGIVLSFLVDDGVSNRGHRRNLFNPDIKCIGIGIHSHTEYEVCTVIDMVGGVSNKKNYVTATNNKINAPKLSVVNINPSRKSDILGNISDKLNKLSINANNGSSGGMKNNSKLARFEDDEDAPEGAISCNTEITTRTVGRRTYKKTVKTYKLEDGSKEVVTIEEEY